MKPNIYYFKGDAKHDPGWYWTKSKDPFANGPFFCYGDAAADCGVTNPPPDPLDNFNGVLMKRSTLSSKALAFARVEYSVRSYMLGASLGLVIIMFWYGVYRVTCSLVGV